MLSKIKKFIGEHLEDIILAIGVILISLLSFALGFIVAKIQEKEPLRIEMKIQNPSNYEKIKSSNRWCRDLRIIYRLETFGKGA